MISLLARRGQACRGKRRLPARANAAEQAACRFWLDAEPPRIRPPHILRPGAMAAQAFFGRSFRLRKQRGAWRGLPDGRRGFATTHPSYLPDLRNTAKRAEAYAAFVHDQPLLQE